MDPVEFARLKLLEKWAAYEASGGRQIDFARAAGITQGTLSTWVTKLKAGEVPKMESIAALCRGFGVPLASLFPPAEPQRHIKAAQSLPSHGIDPALLAALSTIAERDPDSFEQLKAEIETLAEPLKNLEKTKD
jgi:transcriptional regulator with XRE-family HTH domain